MKEVTRKWLLFKDESMELKLTSWSIEMESWNEDAVLLWEMVVFLKRVLQLIKDFHQQNLSFVFQNCLAHPEYHWYWKNYIHHPPPQPPILLQDNSKFGVICQGTRVSPSYRSISILVEEEGLCIDFLY